MRPRCSTENLESVISERDARYSTVVLDAHEQGAPISIGESYKGLTYVLRYEADLPSALAGREGRRTHS